MTLRHQPGKTWVFATCLLILPNQAIADAGLPMIMVTYPLFVVSLLPIIILESWIFSRRLALHFKPTVWLVTLANLFSTLGGIPFAWVALVVIEISTGGGTAGNYDIDTPLGKFLAVTWEAPWLMPYEDHLHWMVPWATLVLFVPFLLISWAMEAWMIKGRFRRSGQVARCSIRRVCFEANLASYVFMYGAFLAIYLSTGTS